MPLPNEHLRPSVGPSERQHRLAGSFAHFINPKIQELERWFKQHKPGFPSPKPRWTSRNCWASTRQPGSPTPPEGRPLAGSLLHVRPAGPDHAGDAVDRRLRSHSPRVGSHSRGCVNSFVRVFRSGIIAGRSSRPKLRMLSETMNRVPAPKWDKRHGTILRSSAELQSVAGMVKPVVRNECWDAILLVSSGSMRS